MPRRTWILALAGSAALLAGLAGCGGLGGPTVITLGEPELDRLVTRAFPLQRRVLEVLEVQLSAPQIRLLPDRNRLALALALRGEELLLGKVLQGRLAFDCALRYDARETALRLTQVRVQELTLDPAGIGPGLASAAAGGEGLGPRLGRILAERALDDLVIYRLSAERLASLRQLGLEPGAVTVTARGVEITLARAGG